MAQLCRYQDELEKLNAEVAVISFGAPESAQAWLKETCSPFRLLLDTERRIYDKYGLERSLRRSWNLRTMWRYLQLMTSGRRWRGIQGDSTQLGGDFIIDAQGFVRLAYRSYDPTDRPPVADLLAVLERSKEAFSDRQRV